MLAVQSPSVRLLALAGAALLADAAPALRVLRTTPAGDAAPTTTVTVTFDRPVAGSLDRTVDPRAIFQIVPATPGTVEWRDPVTLRFRPAAPLTPHTSYQVTVDTRFEAMDGSRLPEPYGFSFRDCGATISRSAYAGSVFLLFRRLHPQGIGKVLWHSRVLRAPGAAQSSRRPSARQAGTTS